jgi:hypothetical protein
LHRLNAGHDIDKLEKEAQMWDDINRQIEWDKFQLEKELQELKQSQFMDDLWRVFPSKFW